jgi:hypothetical protein
MSHYERPIFALRTAVAINASTATASQKDALGGSVFQRLIKNMPTDATFIAACEPLTCLYALFETCV